MPDPTPEEALATAQADLKKANEDLTVLRTRYTPPEKGEYKFELPKDGRLTGEHTKRTAALAAKLGLSQTLAPELITFLDAELKQRDETFLSDNGPDGSAWKKRTEEWQAQALADTEIGGTPEKLTVSAEMGRRVLDGFFSKSVKEFFDATGFGSHPDVLRGFVKLGRLLEEGKMFPVTQKSDSTRKSNEEVFFGKPAEKAT